MKKLTSPERTCESTRIFLRKVNLLDDALIGLDAAGRADHAALEKVPGENTGNQIHQKVRHAAAHQVREYQVVNQHLKQRGQKCPQERQEMNLYSGREYPCERSS